MLECETWYELAGRRHNEQHFTIPREEIAALHHAVAAVRRRNSAFHIRLKRTVDVRQGPIRLTGAA